MILHIASQRISPCGFTALHVWAPNLCVVRRVALTSSDERLSIDHCLQRFIILAAYGSNPIWLPNERLQVVVKNSSRAYPIETGVDVRIDELAVSDHPEKDPCAYFVDTRGEPGRKCGVARERHHEETHRFRERCAATRTVHGVTERCARECHSDEDDATHDAGGGSWWKGEP